MDYKLDTERIKVLLNDPETENFSPHVVAALVAEVETLRRFIDDEVMPRYVEMFDALGLGNPAESVVVTTASALLGKPSR